MAKFFCSNCSYTFEPRTLMAPKKCPYCDNVGSVGPLKDAQDFINEA